MVNMVKNPAARITKAAFKKGIFFLVLTHGEYWAHRSPEFQKR